MIDLKLPKKSKKEIENELTVTGLESDKYPYGLRINLEREGLKKLGISVSNFEVGGKVKFTCEAQINSLRTHER